ncbi:hypothetical protein [Bradyrhizobium sp. BWC-3-1]|uniref:hypothetical protein n=1 Tax=Bradyrhizobium sp. BWC-3-1 TaxID=3080012 RepID=UPI00293F5B06|nr:hypothetical protein [Bradyrhizobium sp. BWC-3-1]WOH54895.1 hypothetical protein RX329_21420 [Bradyrhizobium sp. BWC-3-1]
MDMQTGGIAVGIRFKLNKLGRIRCPKLAGKVGVVVDVSARSTGVTVLFEGAQRPTVVHRDYISPTN